MRLWPGRPVRWVPDYRLEGVPAEVLAVSPDGVQLAYTDHGRTETEVGGTVKVSWTRYVWANPEDCLPL